MNKKKQVFIAGKIGLMSLEEKVGQLMVVGFPGVMIAPEIKRVIQTYHPAGLRITSGQMRLKDAIHDPYASGNYGMNIHCKPSFARKDLVKGITPPYLTNSEYARVLNTVKQIGLENGKGIPMHTTMDMEGNMSCDHPRNGIRLMPASMGVAQSNDEQMAYDVAWATGRQLRPLGVNWLHSPVLGVNTNPDNPEINTRSYSSDFETVARFGTQAVRGFRDAGIVATGKHFPGRGASSSDAHHGLPVIDLTLDEFKKHLIPFKACIDAGLPCVMTAHTIYPCIDSDNAATLSKIMLQKILRQELGFKGLITTDAMEMGSILELGPIEDSILKAVNAGVDLVLFRDEGGAIDRIMERLINAAKSGELPEERINEAMTRTLGVKYDYGVFENDNLADPEKAGCGINDPKVQEIATRSAREAIQVLRDRANLLPVGADKRILLIEQANPLHIIINDCRTHPGIFWKKMLEWREDMGMVEITISFEEDDRRRVLARMDEADILVVTNWYYRRLDYADDFITQLCKLGKQVIVVTNNPYGLTVKQEYDTVIVTYSVSPESLAAAAELICLPRQ